MKYLFFGGDYVTKPVHRSSVCCRSPPLVQLSVYSGTEKKESGSVEQLQDLWNISGSVVCLFRYWQEGDHDLWNNLRICREKSFDINASLLLCWIGQGAKHNIRDTTISVVRVGCQSSMSYYDIVTLSYYHIITLSYYHTVTLSYLPALSLLSSHTTTH